MSNIVFRKPLITSISTLPDFVQSETITFNWVYPTDFTDTGTHDVSELLEYKLYRHIELTSPALSANGGLFCDPETYNTPFYTTPSRPEPIFKLIATLPASQISYTDTLADLSIHADEGIRLVSNRWVDNAGNDIINEIGLTKRRLYYQLIGVSQTMIFNTLPFIYLCHTNGVECKSTLTQVKWNTLYTEGDTVWFNTAITNCTRTAVDVFFNIAQKRYRNVWVSGASNNVYCLDGRNGKLIAQYTLPFTNIFGLRVDPDTGDGIVAGSNASVYRCSLSMGSVSIVRNMNTSYTPNGNNGLVLTKESGNHFASVIANMDTVAKCGLDTASVTNTNRTNFGCTSSTAANIPNVLGIANGTDGGVWVNGHTPIHYKYSQSQTQSTNYQSWDWPCENGIINANWYNTRFLPEARAKGWSTYAICDADHYTWQTTTQTVMINIEKHFLQDVGFVFGATTGINKGKTNGQSYPYGTGTYKPFTSKVNRTGWFGKSTTAGGDQFGRPYTTGSSVDPKTGPNPGQSQKGIAAAIPDSGSLTGNTYNIYQVNNFENKIHKLTWNGTLSTLNYNYISESVVGVSGSDYWTITKPVHAAVDSQNNVWVIQEGVANTVLTILYNNENTEVFPYGGLCTWPICNDPNNFGVTSTYLYGSPYNDKYIEYYLTRNTTFTSLITTNPSDGYRNGYGICLKGDLGQQRVTAREWCEIGSNLDIAGKSLYTYYGGLLSTHSFLRSGGDTTEYNSDNFGMSYIFTEHQVYSDPTIIHPTEVSPVLDLKIIPIDSTPINCDLTFWNDQIQDNAPLYNSVSGYDDLQVQLSATLISIGSFEFDGYTFYFDDKAMDIGGTTNPVSITTQNNVINYVYNDPSLNGKPPNRTTGYPAEVTGMFNPSVRVNVKTNSYYVTGDLVGANSQTVNATVYERWPTANFYGTPIDTASLRQQYLTSWNLSSYNFAVGDNGIEKILQTQIISGYDPLSANFTDISVTRTWPMSSWYWDFGDRTTYGGFALDNSRFGLPYAHVTSQIVSSSTPESSRDDCTTEHTNMVTHLYKGPKTYTATLWVRASASGTTSWPISAGVTDQTQMVETFTVAASRQIKVLEVCPNLSFTTVSSQTIENNYTNDRPFVSFPKVSADRNYSGMWSDYGLISGYAPYVKVSVFGAATARSLPFSALTWDWSDPYVDYTPADYTLYNYPTAGWPEWNNTVATITGEHIFVMPGFYSITLVPIVSAPFDNYISNCDGLRRNMQVYVKEILPQVDFSVDTVSGDSPVTITFNPSAVSAGSFPICRLDWAFDDNSSLTISRLMSAEYSNYFHSSAFADPSDPRNVVVTHEFNRNDATHSANYTITLSAFACNTNSVGIKALSLGPINQVNMLNIEGDVHLIENRMFSNDDDLLLVFEGQKSQNNFTVLLSADGM